MDRSFLFDPDVIAASRRLVCIRLATYEHAEEGAFLKGLFTGRSGELENSVFCFLGPDGRQRLTKVGRSPHHLFGSARELAGALDDIARAHPGKAPADGATPELPKVANVRLALNVAACDNQPLVVLVVKDAAARHELEKRVAALAWSPAFIGRCVYVSSADAADLAGIDGVPAGGGVLIVQPDHYGLRGRVLAQAAAGAAPEQLSKALATGIDQHQRFARTFQNHVEAGQRQGVFWETPTPVTDPMEQNAREKGKLKAIKKD
jgi:hypothetical protein